MPDSAIVTVERTGVMRSVIGLTPEKASEAALKYNISETRRRRSQRDAANLDSARSSRRSPASIFFFFDRLRRRLAGELDLDEVAGITPGFTGADLANLVNEAAIVATRRGGADVTYADFTAAMERIVAGLEKRSRVLGPEERRRVAFHEMGHALVAASLPGVDPVLKVSIIPRGVGALGYTIQRPTEDRFLITASALRNRIAVLLGGRAAEALVFDGDVSTGAADDLQRATQIALEMVTRHGMTPEVGQRTYLPPANPFLSEIGSDRPNASDLTAREIDVAGRDIVAGAFETATEILRRRRQDLEGGAALLLDVETVTAAEFPALRPGPERGPSPEPERRRAPVVRLPVDAKQGTDR